MGFFQDYKDQIQKDKDKRAASKTWWGKQEAATKAVIIVGGLFLMLFIVGLSNNDKNGSSLNTTKDYLSMHESGARIAAKTCMKTKFSTPLDFDLIPNVLNTYDSSFSVTGGFKTQNNYGVWQKGTYIVSMTLHSYTENGSEWEITDTKFDNATN